MRSDQAALRASGSRPEPEQLTELQRRLAEVRQSEALFRALTYVLAATVVVVGSLTCLAAVLVTH